MPCQVDSTDEHFGIHVVHPVLLTSAASASQTAPPYSHGSAAVLLNCLKAAGGRSIHLMDVTPINSIERLSVGNPCYLIQGVDDSMQPRPAGGQTIRRVLLSAVAGRWTSGADAVRQTLSYTRNYLEIQYAAQWAKLR